MSWSLEQKNSCSAGKALETRPGTDDKTDIRPEPGEKETAGILPKLRKWFKIFGGLQIRGIVLFVFPSVNHSRGWLFIQDCNFDAIEERHALELHVTGKVRQMQKVTKSRPILGMKYCRIERG